MIFDFDYINYLWYLFTPPEYRQPKQLSWGATVLAGKQWKHNTFFDGYMQGAQYLSPPVTPATNAYSNSGSYSLGSRVIYLLQAGGAYYGDNGVYEAITTVPGGTPPTGTNVVPSVAPSWVIDSTTALQWLATGNNGNPFYWVQVQPNFIGAQERAAYNCQRLVLEYALNKWFNTTFRQPTSVLPDYTPKSDIYIEGNPLANQYFCFPAASNSFSFPVTNLRFCFPTWTSGPQYNYTIYIPLAVYNALISNNPLILPYEPAVGVGRIAQVYPVPEPATLRAAVVCNFVNLYNQAGAYYSIYVY